jgi:phosphopantetheine adenylyltransferase|tara:strand:+ start:220 stop:510 length:291 start_codon:yes stop_codon:yes gene_type:complete
MAEEKKFSEEELKQINEVADNYSSLQTELGNIGVQKILVEERLDNITKREEEIRKEWKQNQVKEQDLVKILSDKYGPGTLDPKTGTFVPLEENKPA